MRLKPLDSTTNNAYRRQELDLNRTAQEFIDPLTGRPRLFTGAVIR
ncbi:hypothetical protein FRC0414_00748 [Corynebacterium diphtheriae]|nr:hypothetical protein FRC0414_00748 [Corynebacterium diphtheriae]